MLILLKLNVIHYQLNIILNKSYSPTHRNEIKAESVTQQSTLTYLISIILTRIMLLSSNKTNNFTLKAKVQRRSKVIIIFQLSFYFGSESTEQHNKIKALCTFERVSDLDGILDGFETSLSKSETSDSESKLLSASLSTVKKDYKYTNSLPGVRK